LKLECTKVDKPENWNQIKDNIRFIHTVTLEGLVDNQRYGMKNFVCGGGGEALLNLKS
jgi:hypothetical protein